MTLTPHPLLVPWSRKSRAIPLLPLWAVRLVQSHSACTRVHFTFNLLYNTYIYIYRGWVEVYLYSSMTAALEAGEWSAARPGRTFPPRKNRYPFYRRLGGPQGRSGREENLVATGIRSRTVQPVAQSLYRLSYHGPHVNEYTLLLFTEYVRTLCNTEYIKEYELVPGTAIMYF